MESFKDFCNQRRNEKSEGEILLEYQHFKMIPKTNSSYEEHAYESDTGVPKHAHIYAKSEGKGKQAILSDN